jgi:Domain of unknown function (DUF397)
MTTINGMPATDLGDVTWCKGRRSNSSGNCVQMAELQDGQVAVRDSKDPDGPALIFPRQDVGKLIGDLKDGAHDHLVLQD